MQYNRKIIDNSHATKSERSISDVRQALQQEQNFEDDETVRGVIRNGLEVLLYLSGLNSRPDIALEVAKTISARPWLTNMKTR